MKIGNLVHLLIGGNSLPAQLRLEAIAQLMLEATVHLGLFKVGCNNSPEQLRLEAIAHLSSLGWRL